MVDINDSLFIHKNIENMLKKLYTENDNRLVVLGIDNYGLEIIKFEDINSKLFNNNLPIGIKIIGIILAYNDNVYEDFDSLAEEMVKELVNNKEIIPYINQENLYYLLIKEIMHIDIFAFEDSKLFKNNSNSNNSKNNEDIKLDYLISDIELNVIIKDCMLDIKNNYLFGYSIIEIYIEDNSNKNLDINIKNRINIDELSEFKHRILNNKETFFDIIINEEYKNNIEEVDTTKSEIFVNNGSNMNEDDNIFVNNLIKKLTDNSDCNNDYVKKSILKNVENEKLYYNNIQHNYLTLINNYKNSIRISFGHKDENNSNNFMNINKLVLYIDNNNYSNKFKINNKSNKITLSDCFINKVKSSYKLITSINETIKRISSQLINKLDKESILSDNINYNTLSSHMFFNEIIYSIPLIYSKGIEDINKLKSVLNITYSKLEEKTYYYPNNNLLLLNSNKLFNVDSALNSINYLKNNFSDTSKFYFVKGIYEFYHYKQDNFDDKGWGCAYRSFQCLYSWFFHNNILDVSKYPPTPTILDMQKVLVDAKDKEPSIIGSKNWIGAFEGFIILNQMLKIESQIIFCSSGNEVKSKAREIAHHFEINGCPIMIGGGVYAYTIVGLNYDYVTGDCKYLILDPHYEDKDDVTSVIKKGGISWRDNSMFIKSEFYNMCMPQLPTN